MPTVWPYWVSHGTTGGTYAVDAWNVWVDTGTATTVQANTVWPAWVNQPTAGTFQGTVWLQWQNNVTPIYGVAGVAPPPPLTPEQAAEREAQLERQRREQPRRDLIWRNRNRASGLRRKIAARKAEALLLEHLSAEQRVEWGAERAFTVHTAGGKRAYKIAYGLAGNVRLVKADEPPLSKRGNPLRVGARFCMHVYHPDGQVPNEDNVLAQKLLIESNEQHFLELANVS